MKLGIVLVPLGLSLAVGGAILAYASLPAAKAPAPKPVIVGEVRHPVSKDMVLQAQLMAQKPAPFFKVTDIHGIDLQIGGAGKKPMFVYFILQGCPCSLDVQPLFNNLYKRYKDKIDFVGVINAGKAAALDYAGETTTLHPIVSDEALKIMKAYGARQSTYSALVSPEGVIQKMWPGYSQSNLHEQNAAMAKAAGVKELPFDAQYAPQKQTSGCFFY